MSTFCSYCGHPVDPKVSTRHLVSGLPQGAEWLYGDAQFCYFSLGRGGAKCRITARQLSERADLLESFQAVRPMDSSVDELRPLSEGGLLILEHPMPDSIPLGAWKMKYSYVSMELAWSWFRSIVSVLAQAHGQGYAHGNITEEHLFIATHRQGSGPPDNSIQLVRFSALRGGAAIAKDLADLLRLFRELLPADLGSTAGSSFFDLLYDMEEGVYHDAVMLWHTVQPFERLYQVEVNEPEVVQSRFRWRRTFFVLFPLLFVGSLAITWSARSCNKKSDADTPAAPPRPTPLKVIAPVAPITVGVFSGKWDRQFPLHRLSRLWDGYYYVSTHLRGSFGGITDQQLLALAGLPKRTPCADGHSCFGAFESARGGLSERIAFDRRPAAAEDGGGLTPWRLVRGERGALAHGKETPAALTGLSGELLRLLHYDPEECSRELLLFFWKRPSGTAQSGALWVSLLGGLKPLAIMARVHRLPLGVGVRVALHYTREMDAAEAAKQAHIHLASLVEGEPLTLDVHKKRVIITFVVTKPILRRLFQSATLKGGK